MCAVPRLCGVLLCLETTGIAGVGAGVGQSVHDLFHIGADVLGGVVEVIVHHVVGVQAEVVGGLGLLGVVQDQELVGTNLVSLVHAVGGQGVLNPQLGGVGVLGALEDGGGADLAGGAAGGDNQLDVAVAVVQDLGDAVMQEADADDALAGTHVLGGASRPIRSSSSLLTIKPRMPV